MKPEDIRKLLGGYATGTLTESERDLLFAAALEDQALFDALADEESLRVLLSDAEVRGHLLAVLDETNVSETEDLREEPAVLHAPTPMQVSAMPASPPQAYYPHTSASPASGRWRKVLASLTPRRMAFAGAVAAVILIIGAVVTVERSRSAAQVEIAENRQSQAAPERDEAAEKQIAQPSDQPPSQSSRQSPAKQSDVERRNAPAEAGGKPSANAIAQAGRRDAAPSPQAAAQRGIGTAASEPRAPEPAAPLSAARPSVTATDERQRSAEGAADAVKEPSKASESKVEQKDEQVPATAQANAVQPARSEPAPQPAAASPPPPVGAKKTEESDLASKRPAIQPQGFAAGIMNKTRSAESDSRFIAKISDINGTIVSVNAGTDAGLKNGETLEIVRNGTVLGTVRLTDTHAAFAVGSLTRPQGAEAPRAGDSLRRQPAPAAR
jgi:hypothetical protein